MQDKHHTIYGNKKALRSRPRASSPDPQKSAQNARKNTSEVSRFKQLIRKLFGSRRPEILHIRPASLLRNRVCSACGGACIAFDDDPEPMCNKCILRRSRATDVRWDARTNDFVDE